MSGIPQSSESGGSTRSVDIDLNSIAVLPFANISSDPDQNYFADGFCDDLIIELARFRDLFVTSRNASFTDTFSRIQPGNMPAFIVAQLIGAVIAWMVCQWLLQSRPIVSNI